MAIIKIEDIKIHAYHGCMEAEGIVGGNFNLNIWVDYDTAEAEKNDCLDKTVDYVHIYEIVKEEMQIRSKLIETVAQRIALRIFDRYPGIRNGEVSLSKLNPPIDGIVGSVTVTKSII